MPKRNRNRKAAPPKAKRTKAGPKSTGRPKLKGVRTKPDPSDTADTELRFVQPYEADKPYLCPGCNREIPAGQGHVVAVPRTDPDLRCHWHRGCWDNR